MGPFTFLEHPINENDETTSVMAKNKAIIFFVFFMIPPICRFSGIQILSEKHAMCFLPVEKCFSFQPILLLLFGASELFNQYDLQHLFKLQYRCN